MREWFRSIEYPERVSAAIRDAASHGVIVYVSGVASPPNFILLQQKHAEQQLPLPQFVGGMADWIWRTGALKRADRRREMAPPDPSGDALLRRLYAAVYAAQPVQIFLRPGGLVPSGAIHDWFEPLVRLRRNLDREIFIVPETVIWSRRPGHEGFSVTDMLFGEGDDPGLLGALRLYLKPSTTAAIAVAEPIPLSDWLKAHEADSEMVAASYARKEASRAIARLQEAVVGPRRRDATRLMEMVLEEPVLKQRIEALATEQKQPVSSLADEAKTYLREIAADMHLSTIDIFGRILDRVWTRIYDGLHVDVEGLEEVRKLSMNHAIVLCPSHKSHLDYLILSYIFYRQKMIPPHIAAGLNLAFWPMGTIFRRSGAFFLRRSFRGNKLYSLVFRGYVRRLMRERFPLQFFIEGTRSRTGKLLFPKTGMLAMTVEPYLDKAVEDVAFIPISVGYEKIVEAGSYEKEQKGGEKKQENLGELLKSGSVLTSRYGRVHVEFGEPIILDDFLKQQNFDRARYTEAEYRHVIKTLGHVIVDEINQATMVTPTAVVASVLLSNRSPGLTLEEIVERGTWFTQLCQAHFAGARVSAALLNEPIEAMRGALDLLSQSGVVRRETFQNENWYTLPDDRRLEMTYYKNNMMHVLAGYSLLATTALSFGKDPIPEAEWRERAMWLSRFCKLEFIYKTGVEFDDLFARHIEVFVNLGMLRDAGDATFTIDRDQIPWMKRLAFLIRDILESYWVLMRGLPDLLKEPVEKREFIKGVLTLGERAFFTGEIMLRESVSRLAYDNARALLVEQGFIEEQEITHASTKKGARKASKGETITVYTAGPLLNFEGAFVELLEPIERYLAIEPSPAGAERLSARRMSLPAAPPAHTK